MPTERIVEARGLRLHVREWPGRPGAPIVLLHGWLDHCGSFDALAPLLEDAGTCYALDFPGHGDSEWVGARGFYHFVDYLADLDAVLGALGLHGPVRLVGHSMGGAIGLLYAAVRGPRLLHVAALDALPLRVLPDEVPQRLGAWLDDVKLPRHRRVVATVQEAADRLRRAATQLSPAAALLLATGGVSPDPAQGGRLAWKWDPLLRAHSPLPVLEPALRALLRQVETRVLLVRAGRGLLADEPTVRERASDLRNLALAVVEDAGHHLHVERPDEVARLLFEEWRSPSLAAPVP